MLIGVHDYTPSATELAVAAGVFGFGFLVVSTALVKIAVPSSTAPSGRRRRRGRATRVAAAA